jgi:protein O-mannosyl-transferase
MKALICAGVLVLAGAVAFSNSLAGPFLFDDKPAIVDNSHIRQLWPLSNALFADADTPLAGRPVVNLSFALNYAAGELDVRGYHVVNIAVHVACALLLFGLVRRTLRLPALIGTFGSHSTALAFGTALLWMLHPLNTEAVNFVTQRTESLMALFYLLTMYASVRGIDQFGQRPRKWLLLSVLSCALGMGSKESMVTAPLAVALFDRIFVFDTWRQAWRARSGLYSGLASTWVALAALVWSGPRGESAGFSSEVTPWTYLLNQAPMIVRYLGLAIWPRALVVNYGPPLPLTLSDVLPHATAIVVLLLATAALLARRPKLGFLGAWFFITLAPASSLIPIATEVGAERRMYLPLMSLVAGVVIGCGLLWQRVDGWQPHGVRGRPRTNHVASAVVAFLLFAASAALGTATMHRNREYESGVSMAQTILERLPSSHSQHIMGQELMAVGRHEEAMAYFREAIKGDPRAHYNLGLELFNHERWDEAIAEFQQFVQKVPWVIHVVSARTMMGQAYAKKGKWNEAAAEFRQVLVMNPSSVDVRGLLADVLMAQQLYDDAIPLYRQYLEHHPNEIGPLSSLGIALAGRGRIDDAISALERAVELAPENGSVRGNLANALLLKGDSVAAARHAKQAVALTPGSSVAHELLGIALAATGELDEARTELQRAVQLDPSNVGARASLNQLVARRNGLVLPR